MYCSFFLICQSLATALPAQTISLATFNIRAFSDRTRDDAELHDIAQLIVQFDLVAIQETRDLIILERLVHMIAEDFGVNYDYCASPKLKSGGGELYAWVWRTERLSALTPAILVADPGDRFIREPAWAGFRSLGGFDFVVVDFHALFGSSMAKRRAEIDLLPGVIDQIREQVRQLEPGEADFLITGDFNLVCTDRAFDGLRRIGMQAINPGQGTTISDSPYDNIWRFPLETTEFTGQWGIIKFDESEFDNNDQRASIAVSDHRPVWAAFSDGPDDD